MKLHNSRLESTRVATISLILGHVLWALRHGPNFHKYQGVKIFTLVTRCLHLNSD